MLFPLSYFNSLNVYQTKVEKKLEDFWKIKIYELKNVIPDLSITRYIQKIDLPTENSTVYVGASTLKTSLPVTIRIANLSQILKTIGKSEGIRITIKSQLKNRVDETWIDGETHYLFEENLTTTLPPAISLRFSRVSVETPLWRKIQSKHCCIKVIIEQYEKVLFEGTTYNFTLVSNKSEKLRKINLIFLD